MEILFSRKKLNFPSDIISTLHFTIQISLSLSQGDVIFSKTKTDLATIASQCLNFDSKIIFHPT